MIELVRTYIVETPTRERHEGISYARRFATWDECFARMEVSFRGYRIDDELRAKAARTGELKILQYVRPWAAFEWHARQLA